LALALAGTTHAFSPYSVAPFPARGSVCYCTSTQSARCATAPMRCATASMRCAYAITMPTRASRGGSLALVSYARTVLSSPLRAVVFVLRMLCSCVEFLAQQIERLAEAVDPKEQLQQSGNEVHPLSTTGLLERSVERAREQVLQRAAVATGHRPGTSRHRRRRQPPSEESEAIRRARANQAPIKFAAAPAVPPKASLPAIYTMQRVESATTPAAAVSAEDGESETKGSSFPPAAPVAKASAVVEPSPAAESVPEEASMPFTVGRAQGAASGQRSKWLWKGATTRTLVKPAMANATRP